MAFWHFYSLVFCHKNSILKTQPNFKNNIDPSERFSSLPFYLVFPPLFSLSLSQIKNSLKNVSALILSPFSLAFRPPLPHLSRPSLHVPVPTVNYCSHCSKHIKSEAN